MRQDDRYTDGLADEYRKNAIGISINKDKGADYICAMVSKNGKPVDILSADRATLELALFVMDSFAEQIDKLIEANDNISEQLGEMGIRLNEE